MSNKLPYEYESPFDVLIYKSLHYTNPIYYRLGFTPNMITTVSFIFGLISAYLLYKQKYILSALVYAISYYYDCMDGSLARQYKMISKFGDLYDHLTDTIVIVAILWILITNTEMSKNYKLFGFILFIVFTLLLVVHTSHQEDYYNKIKNKDKENYSIMHTVLSKLFNINNHDNMRYTCYFGCGTWVVMYMCYLIYFEISK